MTLIKPEKSKMHLEKYIGRIENCQMMVDKFLDFFQNFKVTIELDDNEDDMLLFQSGSYNYGLEGNNYFEFDLTRQFMIPNEDEFLQLSLTLFYKKEDVGEIDSSNSWSVDFETLNDFKKHILSSEAFQIVQQLPLIKYNIDLNET